MTEATEVERLVAALEALAERAFARCLFPREVREAFAALDAIGRPSRENSGTSEQTNRQAR